MDRALDGLSLAKQLASCDWKNRDKALRTLRTWLPLQHQVPEDEMKMIWKGLFYCVWYADKQPVQIELINRLASLLVRLDLVVSLHYFEVFLLTMRREWSGIDFLRLDKFYLLFRRFMHNLFLMLKKNAWDIELLNRLMVVSEEKILMVDDKFAAQGVNYHISEIFLDELKPFLPISREAVGVLLSPFFYVLIKSSDMVHLNKIKSCLFGCLLRNGRELLELKKAGDDVDSTDEAVLFGTIALNLDLSSRFLAMGSSSDCLQGNRKVLSALHKEFLKLEMDLESAGIEIPYLLVEDHNVGKIPDMIPLTGQEVQATDLSSGLVKMDSVVANCSADQPLEKKKKVNKAPNGSGKKLKKLETNSNVVPATVVFKNEVDQNLVICKADGENSNADAEVKDKDDDTIKDCESLICSLTSDGTLIAFNGTVISHPHMQFGKVASEIVTGVNDISPLDTPATVIDHTVSRKRKRLKITDGQISHSLDLGGSDGKIAKKVKFSMKSNLVWKPQCPLPPQSLRLPPSVAPKGSALKKGVPPGPIAEILPITKKVKLKRSSVRKGRKGKKSVSPAMKRLMKLQSVST